MDPELSGVSRANVVENNVQRLEELPSSEKIKTITTIALPIIAGMACFVAIPFVSGVGVSVGLALTGLFLITYGVHRMLSGNGLVMFKAWGEERKAEADKEKSKKEVVSNVTKPGSSVTVSQDQALPVVHRPSQPQVVEQQVIYEADSSSDGPKV